jgi:Cu/Ag efflux protein CusF
MREGVRASSSLAVIAVLTAFGAVALWASLAGAMQHGTKMPMKRGEMKKGMKMEMATEGIFEGVGKVITVVPELSQIVLGHEEIKGFMKAMPMGMGYEVESLDLVKGLKPGDAVKFKIDAAKKKIISIESLKEKGSGY